MEEFQKNVREWLNRKKEHTFDRFMIHQMGYRLAHEDDSDTRWSAYQTFREKTGHRKLASEPTMKRWFGIGGSAVPGRETLFAICFALSLDAEGAGRFLTEGLREPSFQINDYQEIIYLYGFEHGMEQGECDEMAAGFEEKLDMDLSFCQTHSTHELRKQYQVKKELPKEEFLAWMTENGRYFKGYSRTALDYFSRYKKLILESVREEAEIILNRLLEDTEYVSWKRRRLIRETNLETIRRFVYSNKKIDADLRKDILELAQVTFSPQEPNSLFIRELFSFNYDALSSHMDTRRVLRMTEKRMSDLLGTAIQRKKQIRAVSSCRLLEKVDGEKDCPEQILTLIREFDQDPGIPEQVSVSWAHKWLQQFQKKQKRRCLLLQRGDILPMVIYMVQKYYLKNISSDIRQYNREEAVRYFEEVANATLLSCNMALLNQEYDTDSLFYLCFQENDMYSLADVLDEIERQKR